MHYDITVIIPTYNRASYLKKAIDSVLSQDYSNFEIFISDNASSDNTFEVVKSFNDDRITYYRQAENIGMQNNWEFCLKYPKNNKYIAILEDDNLWAIGHLSTFIKALNLFPSLKIYADKTIFRNDSLMADKKVEKDLFKDGISNIDNNDILINSFLFENQIYASSVIIAKENVVKINFEAAKKHFCMDYYYWSSIIPVFGIVTSDTIGSIYRWHRNNESHKFTNRRGLLSIRTCKHLFLQNLININQFDANKLFDYATATNNDSFLSFLFILNFYKFKDTKIKSLCNELLKYYNNFKHFDFPSLHFKIYKKVGRNYLNLINPIECTLRVFNK